MLALTLKHPWAWAIGILGKRIENRTWAPRVLNPGDWFAIHGGKWPGAGDELDYLRALASRLAVEHRGLLPGGDATLLDVARFSGVCVVCRFAGVVTTSGDPWFEGPVGWRLADVTVLPEPVPCRGAQGLWPLPEDVLSRVRDQYRQATAHVAPRP